MRTKKKMTGKQQREAAAARRTEEDLAIIERVATETAKASLPPPPKYKDGPLEKGEPNVRMNVQRYVAIEVWRGRDWVKVIEQAPHITVSRMSIDVWDRDWKRFDYPIGKAAWRFLFPDLGFQHTFSDKARALLEAIMQTYLVDIANARVLGRFDSEADAAKVKQFIPADSVKAVNAKLLEAYPDEELARIGKAVAVEVDPVHKQRCAEQIMAILNRTETNEMPKKEKGTGGVKRKAAELTDDLKKKIKAFLNREDVKVLPYSKCMKAAAKEGFSSSHVKAVRKEVGHRTKDTWSKDQPKKVKAKADKPKAKAEEKKKPAAKGKAKPKAKAAKATAPAKKKTKAPGPQEKKPAGPQETKPQAQPEAKAEAPTTQQAPAA